jgi:hypothetical protein
LTPIIRFRSRLLCASAQVGYVPERTEPAAGKMNDGISMDIAKIIGILLIAAGALGVLLLVAFRNK